MSQDPIRAILETDGSIPTGIKSNCLDELPYPSQCQLCAFDVAVDVFSLLFICFKARLNHWVTEKSDRFLEVDVDALDEATEDQAFCSDF